MKIIALHCAKYNIFYYIKAVNYYDSGNHYPMSYCS